LVLSRFIEQNLKAGLVVKGYQQQHEVDFSDTFAMVQGMILPSC